MASLGGCIAVSGSTAGAAPSQHEDAPVCYKCQGAHIGRDCPACWQCGSASHHYAECDVYHATALSIINIHNTCRTLAQSAARFLHSDAAEHIQELQRELDTADELVCDLFGPGPRCVKCEQDEMAEWEMPETAAIPAPWESGIDRTSEDWQRSAAQRRA